MTYDQQLKLVGFQIFNALDRLNIILNGNFQIGGSFSLLQYGIIDRKINDLDIVVGSLDALKLALDAQEYSFREWFDYSDVMENAKNTLQGKGKVTNRVSFELYGVKVCGLYTMGEDFKTHEYMVGRKFKVSDPKYSIEAKKRYVRNLFEKETLTDHQMEKLQKHCLDIQAYYGWQKKTKKVAEQSIDVVCW